jgi:pimeloyl-ACP methyl ester carboxylesterase
LKFLNTKQALADLAYFIESYQRDQINAVYNLSADHQNQWVALGGSYPGALSAWFRIKYPHLVVGAISSSGVVNAILNFTDFDKQVARAAGPECAAALREATAQIESNLPESKSWFNAEELSDHDFLYLVADSGAEAVQYGHRLELCDQMINATQHANINDTDSIGKQFANFTVNFWYPVMGNSPSGYDSKVMADPKVDPLGGGRQWW